MTEPCIHAHDFHEPRLSPAKNTFIERPAVEKTSRRSRSVGGYIPYNVELEFEGVGEDTLRSFAGSLESSPRFRLARLQAPPLRDTSPFRAHDEATPPSTPPATTGPLSLPLTLTSVTCDRFDMDVDDACSTCYSPRPWQTFSSMSRRTSDSPSVASEPVTQHGSHARTATVSSSFSSGDCSSCSSLSIAADPWDGIVVKQTPHHPPLAGPSYGIPGRSSLCLQSLVPETHSQVGDWCTHQSAAEYDCAGIDANSWPQSLAQDVSYSPYDCTGTVASSWPQSLAQDAPYYPPTASAAEFNAIETADDSFANRPCPAVVEQMTPTIMVAMPMWMSMPPPPPVSAAQVVQLAPLVEQVQEMPPPASSPVLCSALPVGPLPASSAEPIAQAKASAEQFLSPPRVPVGMQHSPKAATTIMIRNVPHRLTQRCLIKELNSAGFEGAFDFLYMPMSFNGSENVGFAFVNFIEPYMAGVLIGIWHRARPFPGMGGKQAALSISAAETQGLEANVQKWATPRLRRIKNLSLRPFLLDETTKTLKTLTDDMLSAHPLAPQ